MKKIVLIVVRIFKSIRFRVDSSDDILKNHLEMSHKNTTSHSPVTQNEIVSVYSKLILKQSVHYVNNAKGFSILADESTDISNEE